MIDLHIWRRYLRGDGKEADGWIDGEWRPGAVVSASFCWIDDEQQRGRVVPLASSDLVVRPRFTGQRRRWAQIGGLFRRWAAVLVAEGFSLLVDEPEWRNSRRYLLQWSEGEREASSLVELLLQIDRVRLVRPALMLVAPEVQDLTLGAHLDLLDRLRRPAQEYVLDVDQNEAVLILGRRSLRGDLVQVLDQIARAAIDRPACSVCGCCPEWPCNGAAPRCGERCTLCEYGDPLEVANSAPLTSPPPAA